MPEGRAADDGVLHFSFPGRVNGFACTMLFDSGAAASFINCAAVEQYQLASYKLKQPKEFLVANGQPVVCTHACSVQLNVQTLSCRVELLVMPEMFSAFDVLMGSDWLQSNGVLLDYLARTITVQLAAVKTVLKCEPAAPIMAPHCAHILAKHRQATVSAKVAYMWLRKGGQSLVALISSQPINPTPASVLSVHPTSTPANLLSIAAQLTALISEYDDVFAPFNTLPPQRPVGHTIPLQPGCKPPALPSYKMSQPELLEMKKQVAAFLEQGIIEPSSSPYAAPVLFVKKKSEQLLAAYAADEDFASTVDQYDQDKHGLYRTKGKNQIVVPNCQQLKARILVEMHDAQFAGHVGITKTLERISRIFWWPRMRSESDWPFFLSLAEFAVNNSWQESIQSTPFLVNTGQSPLTPALLELPGEVYCPSARKLSEWWQSNVKQARHFMEQAQQRQAYLANKGRRDVEYHPGQLVLLSTKNLRLKPGKAKKLLPRFIGPFKVLEHVGPVAVRLDLPPAMARMHPVFHVALLRPYTSEHPHLPPPVDWLDEAPLQASLDICTAVDTVDICTDASLDICTAAGTLDICTAASLDICTAVDTLDICTDASLDICTAVDTVDICTAKHPSTSAQLSTKSTSAQMHPSTSAQL
ncbi:hypothetical protein QJQ45_018046 [Haematococcus lacustris]|nr:hypothetical protein QJQ45_018046 [Haematococcus lacustris]